MKDGLSQEDRRKRIETAETFKAVNNDMVTLLRQVEEVAKVIRYYNTDNQPDGYFDQFLPEIKAIRATGEAKYDKNREPSQALLYTFIHQLHKLTEQFNERWKEIPYWYLEKILNVKEEDITPDHTYITFHKNVPNKILVKHGTGFTWDNSDPNNIIYYRLQESLRINNINVDEIYSLYFGRNPDVFPANLVNSQTFIKIKNLREAVHENSMLFDVDEKSSESALGLCIASPSLLLREGRRHVTIAFVPDGRSRNNFSHLRNILHLTNKIGLDQHPGISKREARETVLLQLFNNIFHLRISTDEGWTQIPKSSVNRATSGFDVQFELDESFPATCACNEEIHEMQTRFPCIKILLNRDAWLFPYSWLKDFFIQTIFINTHVEGVSNLLFYNELGQVDISVPFAPFGINTEKGVNFVIGNYEMAVKNLSTIDLSVGWTQLPLLPGGFYDYYKEYKNDIDNCSFRIQPFFLHDYKWRNTHNNISYPLFSTIAKDRYGNPEPQSALSDETKWQHIPFDEMPPVNIDEDQYHYNSQAKNGFISFVLTDPEMGFGEKYYRQLFTTMMVKNLFRKKNAVLPNPPVSPLIRYISLSYRASDEINLAVHADSEDTVLFHSYPFGCEKIYPLKNNDSPPFTYSLDTDANILIALKDVSGDEYLNLYLEMYSRKKEVDLNQLPLMEFYWGNGYYWERLPDDSIVKNTTLNLITSGFIKIYIPEITDNKLFDKDGRIWLRIGIASNEKYIPGIQKIYTNVARVVKDNKQLEMRREDNYVLNTPDERLPGITDIIQLTPFSAIRQKEKPLEKLIRVSEYITHRGRAVTPRDYERMALQAFPEIRKIKCLANVCKFSGDSRKAGVVTLVVVPFGTLKEEKQPLASPELLLKVEKFFQGRTSAFVERVDAINIQYEEIVIRCEVDLIRTNHSRATSRMAISKHLNNVIAPWRKEHESPVFGFSLRYKDIYEKIEKMQQVSRVHSLSILQLVKKNEKYEIREYTHEDDTIIPSCPYAVFIPAKEHLILEKQSTPFGLNEMKIEKDFVIWQNETGKP